MKTHLIQQFEPSHTLQHPRTSATVGTFPWERLHLSKSERLNLFATSWIQSEGRTTCRG